MASRRAERLSPNQRALLEAVAASKGQRVTPEGGGYWRIDDRRVDAANVTQTVYALADRGLLVKVGPGEGWRSPWELTAAGSELTAATRSRS